MASRQSSEKSEGSLDPVFVMDVLQTRKFRPVVEPGLGQGYAMAVGHDDTEIGIGVFPEAKAVQIVSGTSILRLDNVQRVERHGDQLYLEAVQAEEKVSIDVSAQGGFTLRRQPLIPLEDASISHGAAVGETNVQEAHEPEQIVRSERVEQRPERQKSSTRTRVTKDTARVATPGPEAGSTHAAQSENERVTIRGRVGKEPHFRTTARRGVLVASFPLGVHPDLETTIWHSVVLFGDRAQKLKEKGLTRGQEIEVVGYIHEREGKTQAGEPKKSQEIYATAIRTTLRKLTDNS